jgi:hypothetical protein
MSQPVIGASRQAAYPQISGGKRVAKSPAAQKSGLTDSFKAGSDQQAMTRD